MISINRNKKENVRQENLIHAVHLILLPKLLIKMHVHIHKAKATIRIVYFNKIHQILYEIFFGSLGSIRVNGPNVIELNAYVTFSIRYDVNPGYCERSMKNAKKSLLRFLRKS